MIPRFVLLIITLSCLICDSLRHHSLAGSSQRKTDWWFSNMFSFLHKKKDSAIEKKPQASDAPVGNQAEKVELFSSTAPVCCRCITPASNGKPVYSCSVGGSCHVCQKYGGQKYAVKFPAPHGGNCAKGNSTGAHYDCRIAFESQDKSYFSIRKIERDGEQGEQREHQSQQREDNVGIVDGKSNSTPVSKERILAQVDRKDLQVFTEPVCCKCITPASNGKPVYSCSTGGSCHVCQKYGGQKYAVKLPAPQGGKCTKGNHIGAHHDCKKAFESHDKSYFSIRKTRRGSEQDEQREGQLEQRTDIVGVANGRSNTTPASADRIYAQDHEKDLQVFTGPVCCKCITQASNGKPVFSCSTGGSCHVCQKYGGQKYAVKLPAPQGGKCATGNQTGAHYDCRVAFESHDKSYFSIRKIERGGEKGEQRQQQLRQRKDDVGAADAEGNTTPDLVKARNASVDKETLEGEEGTQQPKTSIGVADGEGNAIPVGEHALEVSTESVCCKCLTPGSNGKPVYSCSTGGSCHICHKHGGQKYAIRKPAPSGGRCAARSRTGTHNDCRQAFESQERASLKIAEGNVTPDSKETILFRNNPKTAP